MKRFVSIALSLFIAISAFSPVAYADNAQTTVENVAAKAGDVYYTTFAQAFAAASDDKVLTLESDVVLTETLVVDKVLTIDLNGHIIWGTTSEAKAFSLIENKGTLTITDSSEYANGQITYCYTGAPDPDYRYQIATINNAGTLTLEEGKVENTTAAMKLASYAINTGAGAKLTINGGNVINKYGHAIRMAYFGSGKNSVEINGGLVEGTRAIQMQLPSDASSTVKPEMDLTVTAGLLSSNETTYNLAVYVFSNGQSAENVTVNIESGTIDGNIAINAAASDTMKEGAVSVTGGRFNGDYGVFSYSEDETAAEKVISITGGSFKTNYSEMYTASEETVFVANENGIYGVTSKDYFRLPAAVNGVITLDKDYTLVEPFVVAKGETVTIDLNGHTIYHEKACTASYEMIRNNGTLTITDSSAAASGKISFKDTGAGDPTFGWGSYTIYNNGTLVVEKGTIEHTGEQNKGNGAPNVHMYCAIFQYAGSTTVNGGTISTPAYRSARLWKGDMTINGGEFIGQLWVQAVDNTSALTINGGKFSPRGNDGSSVFVENKTYPVAFEVTGGEFATKIGTSDATALAGVVKGGTFTQSAKDNTNAALINSDYKFVDNNGSYSLVYSLAATVNGEEYSTLKKAFEAAAKVNGTVVLAEDVVVENSDNIVLQGEGVEVTLDLNGHSIHYNSFDTALFTVNTGAKLTVVDDTSTDMALTGCIHTNYVTVRLGINGDKTKGGKFVMNGGQIQGGTAAILHFGGCEITINNANIHCLDKTDDNGVEKPGYYGICGNGSAGNDGSVITMNGGLISTNMGIYQPNYTKTYINGGQITGEKTSAIEIRAGELYIDGAFVDTWAEPAEGDSNQSGTTVVGAAVAVSQHTTDLPIIVKINSDTSGVGFPPKGAAVYLNYSEDNKNNTSPITIDTRWGVHTNNLQYAIGKAGDTMIFVMEDQVLTAPIVVDSDTFVDLNGYSITSANGDAFEIKGAALNIMDSIGGGKVSAPNGTAFVVGEDGKATLVLSKVVYDDGVEHRFTVEGKNGVEVMADSQVVVDGIAITATETAIKGYSEEDGTVISIGGGANINGGSFGIYHPQNGNLEIIDSTVTANTAVEFCGGFASVQGDSVLAAMAGSAFAVNQANGNDDIFVHIMDGNFNGPKAVCATNTANGVPVQVQIDNGYFNGKVEASAGIDVYAFGGNFAKQFGQPAAEYAADGFEFTLDGEYYVVTEKVAKLRTPTLTATNIASTGKIQIEWSKVTGADRYELFRATSKNGEYTKIYTTTGTSVKNTSVNAGETYYYKVMAICDADSRANSDFSAAVGRTVDLPQPTVTVTNVASTGKIKISWNAVDGASKYVLYRSETGEEGSWTSATTSNTSITHSSATAGTTYYYKVKAVHTNSAANSELSAVKSCTCDLARPTVTVSNVESTGKIKISWNAVEGASKYVLYRSETGEDNSWTAVNVSGTSITHSSAKAGTTYYYKVKAVHTNSAANSELSAVKSRTCDLARPTVAVKLNSKGKPVISWNAVDGASKYVLYRSTTGEDGSWTAVNVSGTSITHSSAVKGTKYFYKVKAVHTNSSANSALSTAKTITSK